MTSAGGERSLRSELVTDSGWASWRVRRGIVIASVVLVVGLGWIVRAASDESDALGSAVLDRPPTTPPGAAIAPNRSSSGAGPSTTTTTSIVPPNLQVPITTLPTTPTERATTSISPSATPSPTSPPPAPAGGALDPDGGDGSGSRLIDGVPVWDPFTPGPGLVGVAALTGRVADEATTARPILAVKIDNSGRARPQWSLDAADVVFEENVEYITRFVALFHSTIPSEIGPVRSARTGDLDMLAAMNRPVLGWSGGNPGVTKWVRSAAESGVLVDMSAQRGRCYRRHPSRRIPHNLLLDPTCAVERARASDLPPGAARPLWAIDDTWVPPPGTPTTADTSFEIRMDGMRVGWTWDAGQQAYLRSQQGSPHVAVSGARISAENVVELFSYHAPSPVDGRSPNPITVGGTRAVVHRNGLAIPGTWYRETAFDPFRFRDGQGKLIPLDVGRTFVELIRDR